MTPGIVTISGVIGLLVGSFLNVVAWRVPRGESVNRPRSHCPACGSLIVWYDNVPVVSWLVLRGRCRRCAAPISVRYPAVEAATAALWALTAAAVGPHADLPAHLVAVAGLFVLAIIDVEHLRVPDRVLVPTLVLTAAGLLAAAAVDDRWADLARAGAGAALGFGALAVIHLVEPEGMGFGDVKLAALCGLLLGWHGLAHVVVGLYGGFVLGAVVGVTLVAAGRRQLGRHLPFAPFLAAGTVAVALWGDPLARALRDLFG